MEKFWNDDRLRRIAEAVEYAERNHTKSLTFCSSIRQATQAFELAQAIGVGCEMVTGKTPKKERENIIERYKSGEIRHLFNVGVFTTGFDIPEMDCIILARPTMSLALYYQMVGRGVRLDPDKPQKVLSVYDLCGVTDRFGRVEDIRIKKEDDGFRDEVWSSRGRMDDEPLFKWLVKGRF